MLREMVKDGERLLVHFSTVAAHFALGWRLAPDRPTKAKPA